jgi:hypothetical protein
VFQVQNLMALYSNAFTADDGGRLLHTNRFCGQLVDDVIAGVSFPSSPPRSLFGLLGWSVGNAEDLPWAPVTTGLRCLLIYEVPSRVGIG